MNFLLLNLVIASLFTAVTTFTIGVFALFKKEGKANKIFAVYSFSIAWWAFWQTFLITADTQQSAYLLARIMNIGVALIPIFFVHFTISFLGIKDKKKFLAISYIIFIIFSILGTFKTSFFLSSASKVAFVRYYNTSVGFLYHIEIIAFVCWVLYGLFLLYREFKSSDGVRRNQLAYLFWPSLLGYIGGGANWLFVYNVYIPLLMPFGTYFVGFYVFAVAYAILKYQLMDIRVVIRKAFLYSIGIALASGSIAFVGFLSNWIIENIPGLNFFIVPLIAGFVAFILGRIFWKKSMEVDKLKYEFITVAAHKLRTPLTKIKWAASSLKDKSITDYEKKKLISEILMADNQLIELTNELLAVSRAEVGQHKYNLEEVNLEKVVRSVVNDFQHQMREKNIKLSYNYEKNLPKVKIDKIRISSVIQILLENAIAYTKNEIKITIDVYKNNVIFHIEDNGIGIPKEDQPYIFSKFYRTHEAYLSETEGSGIGLFLAKSIIEKHGGRIGVRSEGRGMGSTFWFSLKAV
jgi:signal transduction histidine kinase